MFFFCIFTIFCFIVYFLFFLIKFDLFFRNCLGFRYFMIFFLIRIYFCIYISEFKVDLKEAMKCTFRERFNKLSLKSLYIIWKWIYKIFLFVSLFLGGDLYFEWFRVKVFIVVWFDFCKFDSVVLLWFLLLLLLVFNFIIRNFILKGRIRRVIFC